MNRRRASILLFLVLVAARGAAAQTPAPDFTDADLAALLASRDRGLIYLWSPHMPYSIAGLREIGALARERGLALQPLLDPLADDAEARRAAREARLPRAALRRARAEALWRLGATLHFPTLALHRDGHLDPRILPGFTAREEYAAFIAQGLTD